MEEQDILVTLSFPSSIKILNSELLPDEIISLCNTYTVTHFQQDTKQGETRQCTLRDDGMKQIAPHLLTSSIEYLDISYNSIWSGLVIATELRKCKSLTHLDISGNPLRHAGLVEIFRSLIASRAPLVTLNLRDCIPFKLQDDAPVGETLSQLLSKCASLRTVHIDVSPTTEPFFMSLKTNTTVQELHIAAPNFRPEIYTTLMEDLFEANSTIISGSGSYGLDRCIIINQICKKLRLTDAERRSIPKQLTTEREIEAFLQELVHGGERWNAGKLILLGNGEVGKTSLLNAIRFVQEKNKSIFQQLFSFAKDLLATSRTVGIDQSILILKDGEISVWDFGGQLEYAVTHQHFLSQEMVVIIICHDLSQPPDVQRQQLAYWLDFLHSALPSTASSTSPTSKWKVIIVGTKLDMGVTSKQSSDIVLAWQSQWPDLPIYPKHFSVSSRSLAGIGDVLATIEGVFSSIFAQHALAIPKSFKQLLKSLQSIPEQRSICTISEIFQRYSKMDMEHFVLALKYLHSIGRVVLLRDDLVCTAPKMIPDLAAKFISPEEVRMKVVHSRQVEILEAEQIGHILTVKERLVEEVKVLEYIGVCFRLGENTYLFPSLSSKTSTFTFGVQPAPHLHLSAIRFTAPRTIIFVPGFFCQLIVAVFEKLNVVKRELITVYSNCVTVSCRGFFVGELMLTIESDARAIIALIRATNPDLSFVRAAFYRLANDHAVQYNPSICEALCPTCVDLSFFQAKFPHEEIGTFQPHADNDKYASEDVGDTETLREKCCEPKMHIIEDYSRSRTSHKIDITICWTHNRSAHDFFLSYRVATEGSKASSMENEFGLVEVLYLKLAATKKQGDQPVFVFWDKKCLNFGQNWENGFLHGLKSSKVILLLMSQKVVEGIAKNARNRQDNVYECAILQNELYGTPVIPIFAAEITDDGKFRGFDRLLASSLLPDVPHKRNSNAQRVVDDLSAPLMPLNKEFLGSIKQTVEKLFVMQGISLRNRGEDSKELTALVDMAMYTLTWLNAATSK